LSYYSVIAGWTLHYLIQSFSGFSGSAEEIKSIFTDLHGDATLNILWHTVMMIIIVFIISRGVQKGIEKVSKILMPLLGIILIILTAYSLSTPGAGKAVEFMFYPDFSAINSSTMLKALGTSFFTLSLGMGAMITYGSYLSKEIKIVKSSLQIATIDTVIALLAGLMIFPIVFSNNVEPSAGPSLIFQTLPVLFSKMPGGTIFAIAFFSLLIFAAITSAISLLEVVVAFLVDEYKIRRKIATVVTGGFIWGIGLLSAVSSIKIGGECCLDLFDGITTHYLMPLGGLMTMLVFGWVADEKMKRSQFFDSNPISYAIFKVVTKIVTPVLLVFVVLNETGIF
ncbi:MAG: sodium-dependent transporter, partial [bacterium]